MSLSDVFRLLARKWLLLLLVPVALGISTYFFARHLPKTYSSDTTIYTGIASGYTLAGNTEGNYNSTSNAFDNLINLIKARSTKEEVIYQLLATHLWQVSQNPGLLKTEPYWKLPDLLPSDLRTQLTDSSQAATVQKVRSYAQADHVNALYQLVNSTNPTYSLAALEPLTAARIGTSDLIKLTFDSYNPEVCRYTLELVTQVFLNQSKNLREGQTAVVIRYYEGELLRAKDRLAKAEAENLAFNRNNNIINYDEQSKTIANEKEGVTGELTLVSREYAGAQAALKAITKRLGGHEVALISSDEVLEQRRQLSRLNTAIADQELFNQQQEAGTTGKVAQLREEAAKVAREIQRNVDAYNARSTSLDGIPSRQLLSEWVQDMLLVEANKAKVDVMTRRQQEFEQEYRRMAPLGATLKRIEREIGLAENAYLATLTSLNASKASQQNTQLTANLKIIDPPNLPGKPKGSKLLVLVALSSIGGFGFAACLVLALGLLDRTLKNPLIAARRTGLPVAGLMLDTKVPPTEKLQASQQRSLDQLVRHILLKANTPPAAVPFVLGVFSTQQQPDTRLLSQALAQRCHEIGIRTLTLYPDDPNGNVSSTAPAMFYPAEAAAVQGWPLAQLIQHATPLPSAHNSALTEQVVLIEFPALREKAVPVGILPQLSLVFLAASASRSWLPADRQAVAELRAATPAAVEVVLTGAAPHLADEVSS